MGLSSNPVSHTSSSIHLDQDDLYLAIGAAGTTDAYITFNGTNLVLFDSTSGAKTLAQLVAGGGVSTLDGAFDGGKTIDGATSLANAFQVGGTNDKFVLYENASNDLILTTTAGANVTFTAAGGTISFGATALTSTSTITCQGITNTATAISSSAGYALGANDINITLGTAGASSSKIFYNATSGLGFYDNILGTTVYLRNLAGGSLTTPSITGAVTWTSGTDVIAGTWTFSNVANDGIDVLANSMTSANLIHAKSTSVTSGTLVLAESVDATMTTGYYYAAYNGAATVFGVKRYGEIEITGSAAADMITVSAGNLQLDNGKFEVDTTQDITSYVKRNNATGTNAAFEVEQTHATGGLAVTIDQNATGDVDAVSIENAGTGFAVTTTGGAAGSRGYEFISAASGTGSAFLADGTTGGAAWIGAATTGLIQAQSDGALASVSASLCYLAYSGNAGGASQTGSCLNIVETGAASGTSYAASINSTNNNALQITIGAATKTNLLLTGVASQTASIAVADGLTGNWIGAANVGMVHLKCDGALADAAASMLYSTYTGNTAAVVPSGSCAYFYENGTIAAGGYAVGIAATGGNALNVTTAGAGYTNITCSGANGQTATMVSLDATTGANGWIGANGAAVLKINCDGALAHANASCLNITNSGTGQAATMGGSLRIVDTNNYGAGSYGVYISVTDADGEAVFIDDGWLVVDEKIRISNGGNIDIGGAPTARATTDPTNAVNMVNGTAPVGAAANTVTLYAAAGECRVMDAGGNSTLLSPHTADGDYIIDSFSGVKQKNIRIHLEMLVNYLVEKGIIPAELVEYYTGEPQGALESKSPVLSEV